MKAIDRAYTKQNNTLFQKKGNKMSEIKRRQFLVNKNFQFKYPIKKS
jgi:hypothetical protein